MFILGTFYPFLVRHFLQSTLIILYVHTIRYLHKLSLLHFGPNLILFSQFEGGL